MPPDTPLDPLVQFVEERSDVGTFVIVTPPPQNRVQLRDQILGFQGHATPVSWRTRSLKRWIDFPMAVTATAGTPDQAHSGRDNLMNDLLRTFKGAFQQPDNGPTMTHTAKISCRRQFRHIVPWLQQSSCSTLMPGEQMTS